jgi:predicted transcriptional regulator
MAATQKTIEQIHRLIAQRSGSITMQELVGIVGNARAVQKAITRLVLLGKVGRRKSFLPGSSGISYVYIDLGANDQKLLAASPISSLLPLVLRHTS